MLAAGSFEKLGCNGKNISTCLLIQTQQKKKKSVSFLFAFSPGHHIVIICMFEYIMYIKHTTHFSILQPIPLGRLFSSSSSDSESSAPDVLLCGVLLLELSRRAISVSVFGATTSGMLHTNHPSTICKETVALQAYTCMQTLQAELGT